MDEEIQRSIDEIEASEDVTILYACESGSRAWGFHSQDSDYDVRFIYIHPPDWYLAIDLEKKRDVIERPILDDLDVSGWDLRKSLQLFRKSNPPLLEWLDSPIVYRDRFDVAARLRQLAEEIHSPIACGYHYLNMARGNYREFLLGETVKLKKYFYVLRPLLAVLWIERGYGLVPMRFDALVDRIIEDDEIRGRIDELLERKSAGKEVDLGPKIPMINEYIEREFARLEATSFQKSPPLPPSETLNLYFRELLEQVYPRERS